MRRSKNDIVTSCDKYPRAEVEVVWMRTSWLRPWLPKIPYCSGCGVLLPDDHHQTISTKYKQDYNYVAKEV